ncbi:MAG: protein-disulfide reductase DsbD domain-containing protein, partial [Verrucomicrobiota bacterium]
LILAIGSALSLAPTGKAEPVRVENLTVELIAASDVIQPDIPFEVGLRMIHDPGWHTYWTNMGDTVGQAPAITWDLPPGFTAGPLRLAYPHTFDSFGDVGLGFEDEITHLITITPPANLKTGTEVTLKAKVDWLACEEICVPGDAELALTLKVAESPGSPGPNAEAMTQADLDQPAIAEGWSLDVASEDGKIIYRITPTAGFTPDLPSLFLAPETPALSALTPPETFDWDGTTLTVTASPHRENENATVPDRVSAVLTSTSGFDGVVPGNAIYLDTDPQSTSPAATTSSADTTTLSDADNDAGLPFGGGLLGALLGGFIGGLILNIMPCVFPVISLKIMSFVTHAGESRRKLLNHGLLFTAGILVFFWVLVAFLLGIKALTGQEQGWAAQFQYPAFNMIMTVIMIILALSLFGVFEFGTSLAGVGGNLMSGSGYSASFWSGALATLLATPCTGPFLGAAISFAFGQPAGVTLLFFTIMGLGMASPYILLSAAPGLLKFIPKPGPWMESFKQFMGFPMLITAIWLLWVLEAQIGPTGIMFFSFALVAIAIAAWCLGRFATPVASKQKRWIGRLVALAFILAALQLSVNASHRKPTETSVRDEPVEQTIAALRSAGKNVFVDFTARWCQICQKNKTVIHSKEVEELLDSHNVEFLIVDWTNKDPETLAYLKTFGRNGVPFYPLFPADPDAPPIVLPQYLTVSAFQEAIAQLP